jgi:hypothetical protein
VEQGEIFTLLHIYGRNFPRSPKESNPINKKTFTSYCHQTGKNISLKPKTNPERGSSDGYDYLSPIEYLKKKLGVAFMT